MSEDTARKTAYKTAEVCKATDVAPYVLKYWLTEFPCLSADKDKSPNRIFTAKEVGLVARIRQLLYDEGFTIAGAKKKIDAEIAAGNFDAGGAKKKAASAPVSAGVPVVVAPPPPSAPSVDPKKIARELREIVKMLKSR